MNTLTCESFENGNALEAFEVVDENVGNPKVRQEFEAHWVPGILMKNDKSSDSSGSFHKIILMVNGDDQLLVRRQCCLSQGFLELSQGYWGFMAVLWKRGLLPGYPRASQVPQPTCYWTFMAVGEPDYPRASLCCRCTRPIAPQTSAHNNNCNDCENGKLLWSM